MFGRIEEDLQFGGSLGCAGVVCSTFVLALSCPKVVLRGALRAYATFSRSRWLDAIGDKRCFVLDVSGIVGKLVGRMMCSRMFNTA
jgi:hypothetical protein